MVIFMGFHGDVYAISGDWSSKHVDFFQQQEWWFHRIWPRKNWSPSNRWRHSQPQLIAAGEKLSSRGEWWFMSWTSCSSTNHQFPWSHSGQKFQVQKNSESISLSICRGPWPVHVKRAWKISNPTVLKPPLNFGRIFVDFPAMFKMTPLGFLTYFHAAIMMVHNMVIINIW